MKTILRVAVVGLIAVFAFTGCSRPAAEIDQAKAAIQAVSDAKGDVYASAELQKLNADLQTAMDEIDTQSKKIFKSYGKAKDMLTQVSTDAAAVQTMIPARVEAAKTAAETAAAEAKAAVDEAEAMLAKAPKGKGTQADLEAMNADLAGLKTALAEVQSSLDAQNYLQAQEKAQAVKTGAAAITEQVNAAIQKIRGR